MTPVFGHGRLRLYLLKLLDESPRHGYEVIRLLHDRFMGLYAPSAGTVYPRLAKLEQEGLVEHSVEGGRKVYRITDAGRAELLARHDELAQLEAQIHESVYERAKEIRDEVRSSASNLRDELGAAARQVRDATRERGERGEPGEPGEPGERRSRQGSDGPWGPVVSQKMADLAEGLARNLTDLVGKPGFQDMERELRRHFRGASDGSKAGSKAGSKTEADAGQEAGDGARADGGVGDAWAAETDRPGRSGGAGGSDGSGRGKGERPCADVFDVERVVDRLRVEIGPLAHRAGVDADQVERARDVVVGALRDLREIFDERHRPGKD